MLCKSSASKRYTKARRQNIIPKLGIKTLYKISASKCYTKARRQNVMQKLGVKTLYQSSASKTLYQSSASKRYTKARRQNVIPKLGVKTLYQSSALERHIPKLVNTLCQSSSKLKRSDVGTKPSLCFLGKSVSMLLHVTHYILPTGSYQVVVSVYNNTDSVVDAVIPLYTRVLSAECLFWDDVTESWSDAGCKVTCRIKQTHVFLSVNDFLLYYLCRTSLAIWSCLKSFAILSCLKSFYEQKSEHRCCFRC